MKINELIGEKIKSNKQIVIVSPFVLNQEELGRIKNIFHFPTEVTIKNEIDRQVIAGFIVKVGSLVIDLSLRSKLRELNKRLYENL